MLNFMYESQYEYSCVLPEESSDCNPD